MLFVKSAGAASINHALLYIGIDMKQPISHPLNKRAGMSMLNWPFGWPSGIYRPETNKSCRGVIVKWNFSGLYSRG